MTDDANSGAIAARVQATGQRRCDGGQYRRSDPSRCTVDWVEVAIEWLDADTLAELAPP